MILSNSLDSIILELSNVSVSNEIKWLKLPYTHGC